MTATDITRISTQEALEAVRAAAWTQYDSSNSTCGHRGCEDHPAEWQRIHTQSRLGFGADWDLDEAERFIESAQKCAWVPSLLGHELGVIGADGTTIYFGAKPPAEVTA